MVTGRHLGDSSIVQMGQDDIMHLLRAVLVEGRYQSLDIFWCWNQLDLMMRLEKGGCQG